MLPPTLAARPDLSSGCSNFLGCLPPRASLMHGVLNSMLQFCFYCSLSEEPIKSLNLFGSFHFAARAILQNDRTSIHIQWLSAAGSWPGQANQVHTYIQIWQRTSNIFKLSSSSFQLIPLLHSPSSNHIQLSGSFLSTWMPNVQHNVTEPIASSKALPSKPQALLLSSTRAYPTCDGWTLDCTWSDLSLLRTCLDLRWPATWSKGQEHTDVYHSGVPLRWYMGTWHMGQGLRIMVVIGPKCLSRSI